MEDFGEMLDVCNGQRPLGKIRQKKTAHQKYARGSHQNRADGTSKSTPSRATPVDMNSTGLISVEAAAVRDIASLTWSNPTSRVDYHFKALN